MGSSARPTRSRGPGAVYTPEHQARTAPPGAPTPSGGDEPPGLLSDLLREVLPDKLLQTLWAYTRDVRGFGDEVLARNYARKAKPLAYFVACLGLAFLAFQFAETESAEAKSNWSAGFMPLDSAGTDAFLEAFDLGAAVSVAQAAAVPTDSLLVAVLTDTLRARIGVTGPVTADTVSAYLRAHGHKPLALEYDLSVLKHPPAKGDVPKWAFPLAAVCYFVPFWWLMHRYLPKRGRTWRQTVDMMLYSNGTFWLVGAAPLALSAAGGSGEPAGPLVAVGLIGVLFSLVQSTRLFRHTHQAGFWRLGWAAFLTNVTIMAVFGVLALLALFVVGAGALNGG